MKSPEDTSFGRPDKSGRNTFEKYIINQMKILEKIQKFPLIIRKVILWITVIIIGTVLILVYAKFFSQGFKGLSKKELLRGLELPPLKEKIRQEMPKFEIPKVPDSINSQ